MSDHSKRRVARIRKAVSLGVVLEKYGYPIRSDADREQQFSCDLHGDGQDSRPSARYYPDSFSWHCFACGRSRDSIATVMGKEGKSFNQALDLLEKRFSLPRLPEISDEPVLAEKPDSGVKTSIFRVRRLLQNATDEQDLEMSAMLALWEAFDFAVYKFNKKAIDDGALIKALNHVHRRMLETLCQG